MSRAVKGVCVTTALCGAALVLSPYRGHAACLPTPVVEGTNCAAFTPQSDADVLNIHELFNLERAQFFQLGFFTSANQPVTITNPAWSRDGALWTAFTPSSLQADASGDLTYTGVVALGETIGSPLHVRYTIPTAPSNPVGTFNDGDVLSSMLIGNTNGATELRTDADLGQAVPVLRFQPNNGFLMEQRDHTDDLSEVPGPLPLLGAAAALTLARRLRKRVATAASESGFLA